MRCQSLCAGQTEGSVAIGENIYGSPNVEHLVASGRYQNASEILREGLRRVGQREAEDAYRLETLRSAVQTGIEDIPNGKFKC